ncbi:hypothetical protein F5Y15DRAFT_142801 [Xylariaceae sp. FL0016]|nr:hypothetical protein F5Y15DRAFT_142801 [Xylariaceae sp. FL0016]
MNSIIQEILHNNCSAELASFKSGYVPPNKGLSGGINPVTNCVLDHLDEFRKAEMASSAVVLGLLPTILQVLGSTPVETSILALQRPVLAVLLSAGSPATTTMKASDLATSFETLVQSGDERMLAFLLLRWRRASRRYRYLVSAGQYTIVAIAVGNVVYLGYELGYHAVVAFAPETIFMVPMWTFICVVVHLGAVLIIHLRVQVQSLSEKRGTWRNGAFRQELCPTAHQPAKIIAPRKDTGVSDFLAWVLSAGLIVNLILGTMIFSSLLFFAMKDALYIAGRYLASTVVCRGILRMELADMKDRLIFRINTTEEQARSQMETDNKYQAIGHTHEVMVGVV